MRVAQIRGLSSPYVVAALLPRPAMLSAERARNLWGRGALVKRVRRMKFRREARPAGWITCNGGQSCHAQSRRRHLKPYDIEVQRLKSMKHDKGLIEVSIDALVMARPARDDEAPSTCLRLPVEHARTLLILLKQQFAELDKLQPRSRRSGRC
jgi:hypothetical protein